MQDSDERAMKDQTFKGEIGPNYSERANGVEP